MIKCLRDGSKRYIRLANTKTKMYRYAGDSCNKKIIYNEQYTRDHQNLLGQYFCEMLVCEIDFFFLLQEYALVMKVMLKMIDQNKRQRHLQTYYYLLMAYVAHVLVAVQGQIYLGRSHQPMYGVNEGTFR